MESLAIISDTAAEHVHMLLRVLLIYVYDTTDKRMKIVRQ